MKNEKVYTKQMIISHIAKKCKERKDTVYDIYNALESEITELLSTANENEDVVIKLFEGITMNSTFIPSETRMNNLNGETTTFSSRINPKVNITRNFKRKITKQGLDN